MASSSDHPENKALSDNLLRLMDGRSVETLRTQMAEVGLAIGTGTIHRAMKGAAGNRLASLEKLAQFFGVTVEQLLSPRNSERTPGPVTSTYEDDLEQVGRHIEIPLDGNPEYPSIRRVRFKLSAGASGFGIEYLQGEGPPIVFQRSWYESRGYKPESLFAVKVANGSMEPGLFDGDTVVVNTAQTTQRDGVVFAVNYEGEMVVKRLVRDAGQWWLSSDNPDQRRYPRKVCHEDTFILGEVVHKQSERI